MDENQATALQKFLAEPRPHHSLADCVASQPLMSTSSKLEPIEESELDKKLRAIDEHFYGCAKNLSTKFSDPNSLTALLQENRRIHTAVRVEAIKSLSRAGVTFAELTKQGKTGEELVTANDLAQHALHSAYAIGEKEMNAAATESLAKSMGMRYSAGASPGPASPVYLTDPAGVTFVGCTALGYTFSRKSGTAVGTVPDESLIPLPPLEPAIKPVQEWNRPRKFEASAFPAQALTLATTRPY